MKAPPVPAFRPWFGPKEARAFREALKSGWMGKGICTRLFEERFARFSGAPFCAATTSGTAALELALTALEVRGGEVALPALTNPATSHAVLRCGAEPVFCDVEEDTGNLRPDSLERSMSPKTRAVIAVHLHGEACDMRAVLAAAKESGAPVVEDSCQALRGTYGRRPLGTLGEFGCFSFGRAKPLSTVSGGALVFRGRRRKERLDRLRRMGYAAEEPGCRPGGIEENGLHCGMPDTAAVLGLAQLSRWDAVERRLARLSRRFDAGLEGLSFLRPRVRGLRGAPGWSHHPVRVLGGRRDALLRHLRRRGIGAEVWLYPNHFYNLYRPFRRRLPTSERIWKEFLYLPFYPGLRDEEAGRVIDAMRSFRG